MVKRMLFVLSAVFLYSYPAIQVQLYILINLSEALYIMYFKPFDTRAANKIESFNQITIMVVSYLLLGFSDMVSD